MGHPRSNTVSLVPPRIQQLHDRSNLATTDYVIRPSASAGPTMRAFPASTTLPAVARRGKGLQADLASGIRCQVPSADPGSYAICLLSHTPFSLEHRHEH